MTSVPDYVGLLQGGLNTICAQLGTDPSGANTETKAILVGQLALLSTVIKVLVDKGLITDQELVDTFNAAVAMVWPSQAGG